MHNLLPEQMQHDYHLLEDQKRQVAEMVDKIEHPRWVNVLRRVGWVGTVIVSFFLGFLLVPIGTEGAAVFGWGLAIGSGFLLCLGTLGFIVWERIIWGGRKRKRIARAQDAHIAFMSDANDWWQDVVYLMIRTGRYTFDEVDDYYVVERPEVDVVIDPDTKQVWLHDKDGEKMVLAEPLERLEVVMDATEKPVPLSRFAALMLGIMDDNPGQDRTGETDAKHSDRHPEGTL